jgi:hypothetical protein
MPHQDHRDTGGLGQPDQPARALPDLGNTTRGRSELGHPHRLDRVHDQKPGTVTLSQGHDRIDVVVGNETDGVVGDAEPTRSQRDLVGRLLGTGDHDRLPRAGQRAGHLKEKRGLADTRLATEQEHRAVHDPAAENPVDFPPSCRLALELAIRRRPEPDRFGRPRRAPGGAGILDQGLAYPALRAKAHPFGRSMPTIATSKSHHTHCFRLSITPLNGENQYPHHHG